VPILFDYDPDTGITEYFDYDPFKDQVVITTAQDVSLMLDRMQAIRNNPEIWAKGVKESFAMYASLPPVVQTELMNKGYRLDGKDDLKMLLKEINTNYPYLKATDKWVR